LTLHTPHCVWCSTWYSPIRMKRRQLFLLPVLAVLGPACDRPPRETIDRQVAMQVVLDRAVFEAVAVFQVHVLRAALETGAALTCADIPGAYRIGNPDVEELVPPSTAQKDKSDPTGAVEVGVQVPTEVGVVVVVEGLALYNKGTFVVGRGCRDNLQFARGVGGRIEIDVQATNGRRCDRPTDCEPNVTCLKGAGFEEGYCAATGCGAGSSCPPGTECIANSAFHGVCLRRCHNLADCEIQVQSAHVQDCIGRLSVTAQGCSAVCAQPRWSLSTCCNVGSGQCVDGGS